MKQPARRALILQGWPSTTERKGIQMASFIETLDEAVHGLAHSYLSEISETAIERIMNHVLMTVLDIITAETGAPVDAVYPTLKKLMNAPAAPMPEGIDFSTMPGNIQPIEHSDFFKRLWGDENE